jgi:hypothetical protein
VQRSALLGTDFDLERGEVPAVSPVRTLILVDPPAGPRTVLPSPAGTTNTRADLAIAVPLSG